jgi:hypothetical protein
MRSVSLKGRGKFVRLIIWTVKYVHKPRGARTRDRLPLWGPAATINYRLTFSSVREPYIEKIKS